MAGGALAASLPFDVKPLDGPRRSKSEKPKRDRWREQQDRHLYEIATRAEAALDAFEQEIDRPAHDPARREQDPHPKKPAPPVQRSASGLGTQVVGRPARN